MSEQTPQARVPRRRRLRRIHFIGIANLIALSLLGVHVYNATGLNRYEAAKRQARAGGVPLTFEEIEGARAAWAEEENGARVIEELIPQLKLLELDKEFCKLPIINREEPPPLGRLWYPHQQAMINVQFPKATDVLVQLDQLAHCEGGRFQPGPYSPLGIPELLTSQFAALRFSTEMKSLHTIDRAMRGDLDSIVTDLTVMAMLPRLLEAETLSPVVAAALAQQVVIVLEYACSMASFDAATLEEIDRVLADLEAQERLYRHVLADRAWSVATYDWLLTQARLPAPEVSPNPVTRLLWDLGGKGLIGRMAADELSLAEPLLRLSHDRRLFDLEYCRLLQESENLLGRYSLLSDGFPGIGRLFRQDTIDIVVRNDIITARRIRFARAGLAVEQYRLIQGSFPESLDQLVPAYLPEPLTDPYDDSPLRYRMYQGSVIIDTSSSERVIRINRTTSRPSGGQAASAIGEQAYCFRLLPPDERGLPPEEPFPASQPAPKADGERVTDPDRW